MSKNILIASTAKDSCPTFFLPVFDELISKGYRFRLLSNNGQWRGQFKDKKWPAHKLLLPALTDDLGSNLLLPVIYPALLIWTVPYLLYLRWKTGVDTILCFDNSEKIIFTTWAKIFGLKALWLECPGGNGRPRLSLLNRLRRRLAKHAQIIIFSSVTKNYLLQIGLNETAITMLKPGINLNQIRHQENIFDRLANGESASRKKNFFTLGAIVRPGEPHNIEMLFQAGKKCLAVIPKLQIVVVSGEADKKGLAWLVKKLEIENMVWLVGARANLNKWLDSFDIFITTAEIINLEAIRLVTSAMAAGLAIVGSRGIGWEDLIQDQKNGSLVEAGDSEALAQAIIRLEQNPRLRSLFGEQCRRMAMNDLALSRIADAWAQILN